MGFIIIFGCIALKILSDAVIMNTPVSEVVTEIIAGSVSLFSD